MLIGWDKENHKGRHGIFGIPQAYADCCEEQARFILHSHISIWIENFNDTRNLLFDDNETIRHKAKKELELYFSKIAQSSFGDLYDFDKSTTSNLQSVCNPVKEKSVFKINDVLQPPKDQDLRHMRHHARCQDLNGVIGYYPQICQEVNTKTMKNGKGYSESFNINDIVKKNTEVTVGGNSSINDFNKYQFDMLAYAYPYHMKNLIQ